MSKTKKNEMPNYIDLMIPTLEALKELGGSGSIEEINEKVYKICNFNEEVLQVPHGEFGLVKEVDYRLGWTKTYLKKAGIIVNSSRGIWALNNSNIDLTKINPKRELLPKNLKKVGVISHLPNDNKEVRLSLHYNNRRVNANTTANYYQFSGYQYALQLKKYRTDYLNLFDDVGTIYWYTEQRTAHSIQIWTIM